MYTFIYTQVGTNLTKDAVKVLLYSENLEVCVSNDLIGNICRYSNMMIMAMYLSLYTIEMRSCDKREFKSGQCTYKPTLYMYLLVMGSQFDKTGYDLRKLVKRS